MSLYLWLDLLSISVPFVVSFHPRLKLYRHWKELFLSMLFAMTPYILWDIYFTQSGYWGFSEAYLSGWQLWHLPMEEWLFFICIPYACVFTHLAVLEINPRLMFSLRSTRNITFVLLLVFTLVLILFSRLAYTRFDMIFAILILALAYWKNKQLLRSYYITFLLMLIPFFIVNGVLTGTGIEGNVVWYNDEQNLGIRLGTIPIEDTVYAFSLILLNLFLFKAFTAKGKLPEASF